MRIQNGGMPFTESAWTSVKIDMRRQWNQTKNLNCDDSIICSRGGTTFNRITGEQIKYSCDQSTFDKFEPAYRFGYGARLEYGDAYPVWNNNLELRLIKDWWGMNPNRDQTWEDDREAIRYGWEFGEKEAGRIEAEEEWKRN